MILDLTISQLDLGPMPPERARELGQLGYLQWLGGLLAMADYRRDALRRGPLTFDSGRASLPS